MYRRLVEKHLGIQRQGLQRRGPLRLFALILFVDSLVIGLTAAEGLGNRIGQFTIRLYFQFHQQNIDILLEARAHGT
jgi:hypothetical protein